MVCQAFLLRSLGRGARSVSFSRASRELAAGCEALFAASFRTVTLRGSRTAAPYGFVMALLITLIPAAPASNRPFGVTTR